MEYINERFPYAIPENSDDALEMILDISSFTYSSASYNYDLAYPMNGLKRFFKHLGNLDSETQKLIFDVEKIKETK